MSDLLEHWRDPVFDDRHNQVPAALAARLTDIADEIQGRHIYYERLHALLAIADIARITDPATFQLDEPPSGAEKQLGAALGQAFHQGCRLDDIALAARLAPERVVAMGKRTIRRANWLNQL